MFALKTSLVSLLLVSFSALAAPASDRTVNELLKVTEVKSLIEDSKLQLEQLMNQAVRDGLRGKKPNAAQQKAINNMTSRMTKLVQDELSWDRMAPAYVKLYKETFTEEELLGMLEFYKTPAGQAMIRKMPSMMQKTLEITQESMSTMIPKVQKIQEQYAAELKAAR